MDTKIKIIGIILISLLILTIGYYAVRSTMSCCTCDNDPDACCKCPNVRYMNEVEEYYGELSSGGQHWIDMCEGYKQMTGKEFECLQ
jgi:hypothetical protein